MVKYNGINHPTMATGDMNGTIRFWRDLPDMRLVASPGSSPGYRYYFFQISEWLYLCAGSELFRDRKYNQLHHFPVEVRKA